jgi:hypothetical protein
MCNERLLQTPRIIEAKTDVRVTNESSQSALAETSVEMDSSADGKAGFSASEFVINTVLIKNDIMP